jgi:two-component system cell cycle sensor histidine kinase/response regulator CckA
VTDTGTGIKDENMPHIFEPFFTTKEEGKGTGLGLSTVHGIVKQSGGHIHACSEPGRGTALEIYLPRVGGDPGAVPIQISHDESLRGSGTVLVVEDEEVVRNLIVQILEGNGYKVVAASDGEEALSALAHKFGDVFLRCQLVLVLLSRKFGENCFEILARELPLERDRGRFVQ